MHIQSIPMWVGSSNNYAYIVSDEATKEGVIIDPANPEEYAPPLVAAVLADNIQSRTPTPERNQIRGTQAQIDRQHAPPLGSFRRQF